MSTIPDTGQAASFDAAFPDAVAAGPVCDPVDLASVESFPTSDPPAWCASRIGAPERHDPDDDTPPSGGGVAAAVPPLAQDDETADAMRPANDISVRIHCPGPDVRRAGAARARNWVLEFDVPQRVCRDPLTGWIGGANPRGTVRLTFPDRDGAVAFARRQGWRYTVTEPQRRRMRPKSYADNFRWNGEQPAVRNFATAQPAAARDERPETQLRPCRPATRTMQRVANARPAAMPPADLWWLMDGPMPIPSPANAAPQIHAHAA